MRALPKVLISILVIGVVASSALLISNAFFSDTETSSNNKFQAGTLDLKIDNSSYYNGQLNEDTTWTTPSDLPGHLFFNFNDVKPGDNGEDTISLHVQNDAWTCMDIKLTKNDDVTCTGPEKIDDPNCSEPGEGQGELAQNLHFVFWADDGDNVFETGESIIKEGTALSLFDGSVWTLADSSQSVWSPSPAPLPANQTKYIGKYWCYGDLVKVPVAQSENNNPAVNSGFTCNGLNLNNAAQSDIVMADVSFTAIQSRNNPDYKCNPEPVLVDTIEVLSTYAGPTLSNIVLESGKNYRLDVSGTYIYWPSCPEFAPCDADAEFSHRPSTSYGPGWILGEDVFPPTYPAYSLDLTVNGNDINWGSFSIPHTYSTTLPGTGAKASFNIYDDYYPDNSGSLTVKIYELP